MTRTPHDQFAKSYWEELLSRVGKVEPNRPIKAEAKYADIWFVPGSASENRQILGLVGRLVSYPCLIEPFRNPVAGSEVRDCLGKLFSLHRELQRQAKREKRRILEVALPKLWILSPSTSTDLRKAFGAVPQQSEEAGVYSLPAGYRAGIVVLNQLSITEDTLWLRLLSRGRVQEQAIAEVDALPDDHPLKESVLELLADLRTMLEEKQTQTEEEEELIMRLSPIYLRRRQEAIAEERRMVVKNLLKTRFGELDERLSAVVEPVLQLPPEEYIAILNDL